MISDDSGIPLASRKRATAVARWKELSYELLEAGKV